MSLRGMITVVAAASLATAAFAYSSGRIDAPPAARPAMMRFAQAGQPATMSSPAETPDSYSVIGVGDIMMGSDWPEPIMDARVAPNVSATEVLGPEIASLFATSDVVFGNFEGTIHTSSANAKACRNPAVCFTFRSPPFHAEYLRRAGFTLVSNANNHSRDFGEGGRAETYRYLTAAGLAVSGADTPSTRIGVQTLPDGTRFALVAFGHNPGLLSVQNYARLGEMVREADAIADVVIVSCHVGAEGQTRDRVTRATEIFLEEDRGDPYRFAHSAVDAGADVVFCHGPHVPRAIEVYRGRFIAYSLGNFWTYGRFNLSGTGGMAPIAALEVGGDGELRAARIVSARQD
ncbi:MAG: CapA family protein, partial [Sphingomonadaceae bacterium]|nr:CapA family protein [Sphingomonadaceae bacterium]